LAIFLYMSVEVGTPTYMIKYLISDCGVAAGTASLIAAVYWFAMFIGRSVGGSIGGKVSSRVMVSTTAAAAVCLIAFGMFAPETMTANVPGVDWANLTVIWTEVPVGVAAFICVGLCTSVMWGGIFNMAVEGLGKYTAAASGIFMTMVFGCAVMVAVQAWVVDLTHSYLTSYFVPLACAAYILFYALIGSKVSKRAE
jgi:FHS family L-fucose permease-like MFS transporter